MDARLNVSGPVAAAILLVEDEPSVREVLVQALEDAGLSVASAPGQLEAERLLAGADPLFSLLVTDLALPDGDGGALLDAAALRGLPAIGITGDPDRMPPGGWIGPLAVLAKPFRTERLLAEVARALREPPG